MASGNIAATRATTTLSPNLDRFVASLGKANSTWRETSITDLADVPSYPGIYVFVFPISELPKSKIIILHGRTSGKKANKKQIQFQFSYTANPLRKGAGGVIYVGKTSNLKKRLKGHLSENVRATTNQVLRGLSGQSSHGVSKSHLHRAKHLLSKWGAVFYLEHKHDDEITTLKNNGISLVADRDLLEIKLIAKYAPPFNIKAER
ncbi:MAG: GIY-YIG nuclease family protein [Candidatus Methylacidiphilales bacterium]|nr:GIY-YIG nuclease family protein [Candidatus Methylacidiphilales bacterium]